MGGSAAISEEKWTAFLLARKDGLSLEKAARVAGVSRSVVMRMRGGAQSPEYRRALDNFRKVHPKDVVELTKLDRDATRALTDFSYFRRRYFGRVDVPWATHTANVVAAKLDTPHDEFILCNEPPGVGKALALDTPIPTPAGWSTIKDLEPGDEVFGDDGKPCRVVAKSEVFYGHDCYEVSTDDGASVIANAAHEWSVRLHGHGQYGTWKPKDDYEGKTGPKRSPDGRHIHTTEFLAKKRSKRPQLPLAGSLDLPDADLPIDPYTLGVWLGDGNSRGARITCHPDDQPFIRGFIEEAGYVTHDTGAPMNFGISGAVKWSRVGNLVRPLRDANLLHNKHIPEAYFRASAAQRLALLQGLIDTDGHVAPSGHIEFCAMNRRLAKGVQQLVYSLGVKASLNTGRATIDGRDCGEKYRVLFLMADAARLPRKAERTRNGVRTPSRYLTVTPVESAPTQCIQVDSPSHLYLAGEGMMVTHNSTFWTMDLPAWLICRNRAIRIMLGSASQTVSRQYAQQLRREFEREVPMVASEDDKKKGLSFDAVATLIEDFGAFKPPRGEEWTADNFVVRQVGDAMKGKKEPTVSAYGADSTFIGHRVDVGIWDDLVSNKNTVNPESREKLALWWPTFGETRIEPGGLMVVQGQRLHSEDLYHTLEKIVVTDFSDADDEGWGKAIGTRKKYHHIKYKAHYDENCREVHHPEKALPYDPENPTGSGCLLDPRRLTYRKLMGVKDQDNRVFMVTYQQEDVDPAQVLVPLEWIKGGRDPVTQEEFPGCWDNDRVMGVIPKNLRAPNLSIVTADPSPSKYWSIQWWVHNLPTEQQFLIDHYRQAMGANDFLDLISGTDQYVGLLEDMWQASKKTSAPITHVIVERNAAQRFLLQYDFVKNWQRTRNVRIIAHDTYSNKTDPKFGVQALLPQAFRYGRVRLPNGDQPSRGRCMPLVNEVTRWPETSTDDCVMSMWFGSFNVPRLRRELERPANPPARRMPSWLSGR